MNKPINPSLSFLYDSFTNLVSGLGTSKDKNFSNQYTLNIIDPAQLEFAYRGDWVARKVVDVPAHDMTREWRGWQAEPDQITKLEATEKNFDVQQKLRRALSMARLYGGAAIIVGIKGDKNPEKELNIETIKENSLSYLHVCSQYGGLSASELNNDIMDPYYGEPKYYSVTGVGSLTTQIHPSRVIKLIGCELPDASKAASGTQWGDSILQAIDDAIKNVALTSSGAAALVQEAKTDIIKVPGLTANIANADYRARIIERFRVSNIAKSVVNTTIIDKEEDWDRVETNFAQLPELLRMYLLIVSGAADIPATRLLGQSAVGLNATGEGDLINYYDHIRSQQNTMLSPAIRRLDEIIIRSALGKRDPKIWYMWNSLWQLDQVKRAEVDLKKAQTHQIDVTMGLLPLDALKEGRKNQLIEDGFYPGFESAYEEAEQLEENDPDVDQQFETSTGDRRKRVAKDTKPRSLYVYRPVKNAAEIIAWAKGQGFKNVEPAKELHATIMYSKEPVDWMKVGAGWPTDGAELKISEGGPRLVEPLGDQGAIVLFFASNELTYRHCSMKDLGCSYDYDEYQPHITITYDPGDVDLSKVVPYRGKIVFGPEVFEEIEREYARDFSYVGKHKTGKRSFNWLPDPPDFNDRPFRVSLPVGRLPRVDLRSRMSSIEDQQDMDSCIAHALTSAAEFLHDNQDLSRMFLYYNLRDMEHSIQSDAGGFTRTGIKVLHQLGLPPESMWPYDESKLKRRPTQAVYNAAASNKITQYMRLYSLDDMLNCLNEGFPFTIGFMVYDSFTSVETTSTGKVPMPLKGEKSLGGHLVLASGYDADKQVFMFKNSYGAGWGDQGYGEMPFAYVQTRDLSDDFWTIRK